MPGDKHLLLGKHSVQNYRSAKLKAVKGVILKKSLSVAAVTLLFLHCFFVLLFYLFCCEKSLVNEPVEYLQTVILFR